ncbi:MAG: AbrB/MazE/SpoVT family DNA-binding domain-containing protein [Thermoplasmata archaeon]
MESTKGPITIPKDIRYALGIRPGDQVRFDIEGGARAVLQKAEPSKLTKMLGNRDPSKASGMEHQWKVRREGSPTGTGAPRVGRAAG